MTVEYPSLIQIALCKLEGWVFWGGYFADREMLFFPANFLWKKCHSLLQLRVKAWEASPVQQLLYLHWSHPSLWGSVGQSQEGASDLGLAWNSRVLGQRMCLLHDSDAPHAGESDVVGSCFVFCPSLLYHCPDGLEISAKRNCDY